MSRVARIGPERLPNRASAPEVSRNAAQPIGSAIAARAVVGPGTRNSPNTPAIRVIPTRATGNATWAARARLPAPSRPSFPRRSQASTPNIQATANADPTIALTCASRIQSLGSAGRAATEPESSQPIVAPKPSTNPPASAKPGERSRMAYPTSVIETSRIGGAYDPARPIRSKKEPGSGPTTGSPASDAPTTRADIATTDRAPRTIIRPPATRATPGRPVRSPIPLDHARDIVPAAPSATNTTLDHRQAVASSWPTGWACNAAPATKAAIERGGMIVIAMTMPIATGHPPSVRSGSVSQPIRRAMVQRLPRAQISEESASIAIAPPHRIAEATATSASHRPATRGTAIARTSIAPSRSDLRTRSHWPARSVARAEASSSHDPNPSAGSWGRPSTSNADEGGTCRVVVPAPGPPTNPEAYCRGDSSCTIPGIVP